jgi:hypothetical protein
MRKTKPESKNLKLYIYLFIFLLLYSLIHLFVSPAPVHAQEVSLSVSPPLTEVVIQPGKSFTQTFTVKNEGVPAVVVPSIVPFVPLDNSGHAEIIEDENSVNAFSSWFSFDQTPASLGGAEGRNFNVKITPPENANEKDYYFTFLITVQGDNNLGINNSQSQARIGANILVNVSKDGNPAKKGFIANFSAAKIIDSFTGITYKVLITNSGNSFFKPIGNITVNQIFGKVFTLNLAPLNVLAGGSRDVSCINGEDLIPCKIPGKFLIGIYTANLNFTMDGSGAIIEKQIYTVAFPFSIIIGLIIIFIIYRIIKRLTSRI